MRDDLPWPSVRIRLGPQRLLTVPAIRPSVRPAGPSGHAPGSDPPSPPPEAPESPGTPPLLPPGFRPLIALVEAVPTNAAEFVSTLLKMLEGQGLRSGLVSLEPQNRLGIRFGQPERSQHWLWKHQPEGLAKPFGGHRLIPAPDNEEALDGSTVGLVLDDLAENVDLVAVDLGCRWNPRLFRPVLSRATHIWVVSLAGKYSALEMRMEQAEFSGWTDLRKVRQVVLGGGETAGFPGLSGQVVALPDSMGKAAQAFIRSEFGGWVR